ncbi:hypothetical protein [Micromonospora carbonacea]|nr:hypothetical protein [Micromonospora carbonacea]MBB5825968.1 hypothetical protein [Micromonospora carbonacea]
MSENKPENPDLEATAAEDIEVVAHSDEEEEVPGTCITNNSNAL